MMASFQCCGISPPPPKTNDDIEQSPAQGEITVEGDVEQLNGVSVRFDSLSVRQLADAACQLLYRGLSSWHVIGPLVKAFGDVRVEPRRLRVEEILEPPDASLTDELNAPQEYAVLVYQIHLHNCHAGTPKQSQKYALNENTTQLCYVMLGLISGSSMGESKSIVDRP